MASFEYKVATLLKRINDCLRENCRYILTRLEIRTIPHFLNYRKDQNDLFTYFFNVYREIVKTHTRVHGK